MPLEKLVYHSSFCVQNCLTVSSVLFLGFHPACIIQVERLGDAKHQVREAAAAALQTILQTWDLPQALSKLLPIWSHRSPKVKQSAMQAVTEAIAAQPVAIALPGNWDQFVLKPAAHLLDDANR